MKEEKIIDNEIIKNDNIEKETEERSSTFINESSGISAYLPGLKKKSYTIASKSINMQLLRLKSNDFSNINPLRDVNKKHKEDDTLPIKEIAIMESVVNLKIQYILFNIRDFIRKYQIETNPEINSRTYKILRFIRNISLFIYGIIIFFERPWFCYDKTTIPLPSYFKFQKSCKNIAFVGIHFINNYALRIIEIIITLMIFITQLIKYKNESILEKTNIGVNKLYNIIQIISFISLILCFIDLIIAVSTGRFPIVNFILRAFIYIYMIRRIRRNWVRIGKVLWRTKTVFLFLFINIFLFSLIGCFLFKKADYYFGEFHKAVFQLYILLSTCNFPDIMLATFTYSKLSVFYFIAYISINYFIILSYLKTLYYTKYYVVNKEDCLNIIKYIIQNDFNKDIFKIKQFKKFLYNQKYSYSLNDNEYNNILILLDIYDKNNDLFNDLTKIVEKTPEDTMISKTVYGNYILQSKILEVVINWICIITLLISYFDNILVLSIEFIWSVLLLFELYSLIRNLGYKRFIFHHFNRVVFHIFNLIVIAFIIYLIILDEETEDNSAKYKDARKILKIFLSLRTIRIFVFLDKFVVIKNIYTIIRNSKEMFYRNLFTLYSLFLLFSTFSILLTGGRIKNDSFEKNDAIPEDYAYINFNDFLSSYIACFSLLMINNLNILVNSLTYDIDSNKFIFEFYFATFYFLSTLIIINIIQTLLLELYINSDYSFNDKDKPKKLVIEEEIEEEDSNENEEEEDEIKDEIEIHDIKD